MKKLAAILLALTMVLALCACGDSSQTPNNPGEVTLPLNTREDKRSRSSCL